MGKVVFITGSVRSGKSKLAVEFGEKSSKKIVFLASCAPLDEEMKKRVAKHKQSRPRDWKTIEEPIDAADVITEAKADELVIFDCLTLWISNIMLKFDKEKLINEKIQELFLILSKTKAEVIVVSNEVGWGIVPENKLARQFRDIVGITHQKLAGISDEVYLVTAGIAQKLKESHE
ncbi:MAG: bifunctional adenosylcobinamide kinase/adenosylcobinamide-phosphate guanylyltransferase [Candidatus Omnitrophica bacterium]|nr:bifunctional adenosylcobinamide kinase/adenosylcobinamide-phosphate guanylyltransferase [Candidatus Omnitrophota bacterium]